MSLEQHIAQLEVTMDDTKAVDIVHSLGYLLCCPQQRSLQHVSGFKHEKCCFDG